MRQLTAANLLPYTIYVRQLPAEDRTESDTYDAELAYHDGIVKIHGPYLSHEVATAVCDALRVEFGMLPSKLAQPIRLWNRNVS